MPQQEPPCPNTPSPQQRTRNTVQRRAVLCAVREMAGYHPTAAEVFTRLKGDHPQMSLATVYRALHALVEQGQIGEARIDNVTRYDASPEPHHHVVCRGCGAVGDVFAPLPPAALRRLREASPFALDVRSLHLSGVCPVCAAAAA